MIARDSGPPHRRSAQSRRALDRGTGDHANARPARRPAADRRLLGHPRRREPARPGEGRAGGGVILFGPNVNSPSQLTALDASLQAAASAGGRPPLIIATDQEGGEVKRIPWAPPGRSAKQLGALPASASTRAGSLTAAALHADGVNVDLAPVADVPHGPADFIEQQQRAFSTNRFTVANDAPAFAGGLEGHGCGLRSSTSPGWDWLPSRPIRRLCGSPRPRRR